MVLCLDGMFATRVCMAAASKTPGGGGFFKRSDGASGAGPSGSMAAPYAARFALDWADDRLFWLDATCDAGHFAGRLYDNCFGG